MIKQLKLFKKSRHVFFSSVECVIDDDCLDDQACHNNKCVEVCNLDNPCATGAICYGKGHQSQCKCPAGLDVSH